MQALCVVEPSFGNDFVAGCSHIIYIGLGHRDSHGDVSRVGLVNVARQRRNPQWAVLDRRFLVGLAINGDGAIGVHVLFTFGSIKDVYFEPIGARGQVGQVDGRVGSVQVAGFDGLLAAFGGDFPSAVGVRMLLIGGVVGQWQFNGLVIEIDVFVQLAQLDATARAHDEAGALFLGLAGVVGGGGDNLVVVV